MSQITVTISETDKLILENDLLGGCPKIGNITTNVDMHS
jgi:hypothetical protein